MRGGSVAYNFSEIIYIMKDFIQKSRILKYYAVSMLSFKTRRDVFFRFLFFSCFVFLAFPCVFLLILDIFLSFCKIVLWLVAFSSLFFFLFLAVPCFNLLQSLFRTVGVPASACFRVPPPPDNVLLHPLLEKRCCCCCTSGGGLPEKSPCCLSWLWMRWMVLVLVTVRGNLKKTWGRARYLASRCIAASMMVFFLEPVGVPASGCFQVPCPPNDVLLLERKCSFCCCGCSWRATFKDFLLSINVVGIVNAGGERRQPLKK